MAVTQILRMYQLNNQRKRMQSSFPYINDIMFTKKKWSTVHEYARSGCFANAK